MTGRLSIDVMSDGKQFLRAGPETVNALAPIVEQRTGGLIIIHYKAKFHSIIATQKAHVNCFELSPRSSNSWRCHDCDRLLNILTATITFKHRAL